MQRTYFIIIALLTFGVAGWLLYDGLRETAPVTYTGNFQADDDTLYKNMRADLQAFLQKQNKQYGGWLDDEVAKRYAATGKKAESFAAVAGAHYGAKRRYYNQLVKNLNTKYEH